jgi:hypothetical protein
VPNLIVEEQLLAVTCCVDRGSLLECLFVFIIAAMNCSCACFKQHNCVAAFPAAVSLALAADLFTQMWRCCCCCHPSAGSIVSSVDNCKALQQRITPAEQRTWPLIFDANMDWNSYG